MNVLVIGQGGREHALVKAIKASSLVESVSVSPGNAGMSKQANVWGVPTSEVQSLISKAKEEKIDLVVIGPEAELTQGLSDQFREAGFYVFGPSQKSSELEGSKFKAKKFMLENDVPTAKFVLVRSVEEVRIASEEFSPPYVLKADGLAAGKGVFITPDKNELLSIAKDLFENKKLGSAGDIALFEEFKKGEELSVLVLTNGSEYEILPYFRDHKRLLDEDKGPNTGGMGVLGPITIGSDLSQEIENKIVKPTILGLKKNNFLYRGVIFIGIMLTEEGPSVLEYNVRFGDPETQALLPILDGDWAQILMDIAQGKISKLKWKPQFSTCVVLASEGYPDNPIKDVLIEGDVHCESEGSYLLHAGTKKVGDHFVTNGGRVLNAIGLGKSQEVAMKNAYDCSEKVSWPGLQKRKDIGKSHR